MAIKERILTRLKETVKELVLKEYENIKFKLRNDIEIDDIKEELSNWDSLTIPPDYAYEKIDFYEHDGGLSILLDFDLWIENEESDLTLSCEVVVDKDDNITSFKIQDIHTL